MSNSQGGDMVRASAAGGTGDSGTSGERCVLRQKRARRAAARYDTRSRPLPRPEKPHASRYFLPASVALALSLSTALARPGRGKAYGVENFGRRRRCPLCPPPKDLDGYFPFTPPATKEAWASAPKRFARRRSFRKGSGRCRRCRSTRSSTARSRARISPSSACSSKASPAST